MRMVGQQLDVEASELGTGTADGDTADGGPPAAAPDEGSSGPGAPAAATGGPVSRAARARSWLAAGRRRTIIGWLILALLFGLRVKQAGVPSSDDEVLIWLTACLFV